MPRNLYRCLVVWWTNYYAIYTREANKITIYLPTVNVFPRKSSIPVAGHPVIGTRWATIPTRCDVSRQECTRNNYFVGNAIKPARTIIRGVGMFNWLHSNRDYGKFNIAFWENVGRSSYSRCCCTVEFTHSTVGLSTPEPTPTTPSCRKNRKSNLLPSHDDKTRMGMNGAAPEYNRILCSPNNIYYNNMHIVSRLTVNLNDA